MKKTIFSLVFLLISCKNSSDEACDETNLVFENPQPINDSEINRIPHKYAGRFINSDSTYLTILENCIYNENFYKNKVSYTELDSLKKEFKFEKEKLVDKDNAKIIFNYRFLKDSIELTYPKVDTVFAFSNFQKAKRINNQLVINEKDSVFWKVKVVSIKNNLLKIKYFSFSNDLKKIDSITRIKSKLVDSTKCILKPSRNEFKKIINSKTIGHEIEYKKLQNPNQ